MRRILSVLLLLAFAAPCFAWGTKEHLQLTRLAVRELLDDPNTPPAMKDWLRAECPAPGLPDIAGEKQYLLTARVGAVPRGVDGLAFWATVPDMNALMDPPGRKIAPYGVHERLLHFIDVEYFCPGNDHSYKDDLSHMPKATDFPRDAKDPRYERSGMLPFRVEECYKNLVTSIRDGRLIDTPGQLPRDEHATHWAGFLAHYSEDNTQPQHATIDYQSATYFPSKATGVNVHSAVEYLMVDDEANDHAALRQEYWDKLSAALHETKDPVPLTDLWEATVETSLLSYQALPLIGKAAQSSTKDGVMDLEAFFHFRGTCRGKEMTVLEMKATQQAWAVHRVARVWRQAWDEAGKK